MCVCVLIVTVSEDQLKKNLSFLSMRSPMTEGETELVQSMASVHGGHSEISIKDNSVGEGLIFKYIRLVQYSK